MKRDLRNINKTYKLDDDSKPIKKHKKARASVVVSLIGAVMIILCLAMNSFIVFRSYKNLLYDELDKAGVAGKFFLETEINSKKKVASSIGDIVTDAELQNKLLDYLGDTINQDEFVTLSGPVHAGLGFSFLHDASGNIISSTKDIPEEITEEICRKPELEGRRDTKNYLMSSCKLDGMDYYIVSTISKDVIADSTRPVMLITFGIMIFAVIMLQVLFVVTIKVRKEQNEEIQRMSMVDTVTGGPSFARFQEIVKSQLAKNAENMAIVTADIDGFKMINNAYGYEAGNSLIEFMYHKIKDNLNISYQGESVTHVNADQFVILFHLYSKEELERRLTSIRAELEDFYLDGKKRMLVPVFGIYMCEPGKTDVREMADYAAIARKKAKNNIHEFFYAYYDESEKERIIKNKIIETEMEDAIKNKEFQVYYQPKYSTIDNSIVGAEALVRWQKPDGSFVYPSDFLPLFESNGFINKLDTYMFNEVCTAQRRWLDKGLAAVPVSVNLSRVHLYDSSFIQDYRKMITSNNVPVNLMQLEITESAIFDNSANIKSMIEELHACGITILMDDFGTGYSSLMMIKDVDIDVLKLDKSFVDDIGDGKSERIIEAIIHLARSIDIEVTAEGVETKEQYEFLRNIGCDNIQGYYFARPMPQAAFEKLL